MSKTRDNQEDERQDTPPVHPVVESTLERILHSDAHGKSTSSHSHDRNHLDTCKTSLSASSVSALKAASKIHSPEINLQNAFKQKFFNDQRLNVATKPEGATSKKLKKILKAITVQYDQTDLPGTKVYHGTTKDQVNSVKSGPKNIGKGLGGPGLYLALKNEISLANEFSDIAKQSTANPLAEPIVMEGYLNPYKPYTIARIKIAQRGHAPNLKEGVFSADWSKDTHLREFIYRNFDIIEVIGAADAGYAINCNRFIVVTQRAGTDSIRWNPLENKSISSVFDQKVTKISAPIDGTTTQDFWKNRYVEYQKPSILKMISKTAKTALPSAITGGFFLTEIYHEWKINPDGHYILDGGMKFSTYTLWFSAAKFVYGELFIPISVCALLPDATPLLEDFSRLLQKSMTDNKAQGFWHRVWHRMGQAGLIQASMNIGTTVALQKASRLMLSPFSLGAEKTIHFIQNEDIFFNAVRTSQWNGLTESLNKLPIYNSNEEFLIDQFYRLPMSIGTSFIPTLDLTADVSDQTRFMVGNEIPSIPQVGRIVTAPLVLPSFGKDFSTPLIDPKKYSLNHNGLGITKHPGTSSGYDTTFRIEIPQDHQRDEMIREGLEKIGKQVIGVFSKGTRKNLHHQERKAQIDKASKKTDKKWVSYDQKVKHIYAEYSDPKNLQEYIVRETKLQTVAGELVAYIESKKKYYIDKTIDKHGQQVFKYSKERAIFLEKTNLPEAEQIKSVSDKLLGYFQKIKDLDTTQENKTNLAAIVCYITKSLDRPSQQYKDNLINDIISYQLNGDVAHQNRLLNSLEGNCFEDPILLKLKDDLQLQKRLDKLVIEANESLSKLNDKVALVKKAEAENGEIYSKYSKMAAEINQGMKKLDEQLTEMRNQEEAAHILKCVANIITDLNRAGVVTSSLMMGTVEIVEGFFIEPICDLYASYRVKTDELNEQLDANLKQLKILKCPDENPDLTAAQDASIKEKFAKIDEDGKLLGDEQLSNKQKLPIAKELGEVADKLHEELTSYGEQLKNQILTADEKLEIIRRIEGVTKKLDEASKDPTPFSELQLTTMQAIKGIHGVMTIIGFITGVDKSKVYEGTSLEQGGKIFFHLVKDSLGITLTVAPVYRKFTSSEIKSVSDGVPDFIQGLPWGSIEAWESLTSAIPGVASIVDGLVNKLSNGEYKLGNSTPFQIVYRYGQKLDEVGVSAMINYLDLAELMVSIFGYSLNPGLGLLLRPVRLINLFINVGLIVSACKDQANDTAFYKDLRKFVTQFDEDIHRAYRNSEELTTDFFKRYIAWYEQIVSSHDKKYSAHYLLDERYLFSLLRSERLPSAFFARAKSIFNDALEKHDSHNTFNIKTTGWWLINRREFKDGYTEETQRSRLSYLRVMTDTLHEQRRRYQGLFLSGGDIGFTDEQYQDLSGMLLRRPLRIFLSVGDISFTDDQYLKLSSKLLSALEKSEPQDFKASNRLEFLAAKISFYMDHGDYSKARSLLKSALESETISHFSGMQFEENFNRDDYRSDYDGALHLDFIPHKLEAINIALNNHDYQYRLFKGDISLRLAMLFFSRMHSIGSYHAANVGQNIFQYLSDFGAIAQQSQLDAKQLSWSELVKMNLRSNIIGSADFVVSSIRSSIIAYYHFKNYLYPVNYIADPELKDACEIIQPFDIRNNICSKELPIIPARIQVPLDVVGVTQDTFMQSYIIHQRSCIQISDGLFYGNILLPFIAEYLPKVVNMKKGIAREVLSAVKALDLAFKSNKMTQTFLDIHIYKAISEFILAKYANNPAMREKMWGFISLLSASLFFRFPALIYSNRAGQALTFLTFATWIVTFMEDVAFSRNLILFGNTLEDIDTALKNDDIYAAISLFNSVCTNMKLYSDGYAPLSWIRNIDYKNRMLEGKQDACSMKAIELAPKLRQLQLRQHESLWYHSVLDGASQGIIYGAARGTSNAVATWAEPVFHPAVVGVLKEIQYYGVIFSCKTGMYYVQEPGYDAMFRAGVDTGQMFAWSMAGKISKHVAIWSEHKSIEYHKSGNRCYGGTLLNLGGKLIKYGSSLLQYGFFAKQAYDNDTVIPTAAIIAGSTVTSIAGKVSEDKGWTRLGKVTQYVGDKLYYGLFATKNATACVSSIVAGAVTEKISESATTTLLNKLNVFERR